ncbi:MAG: response regulator transcription factor [Pseudomonadota bacterium]
MSGAGPTPTQESRAARARAPTIFVVDDDEAVRDSLRALLESHCLDVEDYGSGADFLGRYGCDRDGCLVLDINLPGMSGHELVKVMRAKGIDIPVILITGRVDAEAKALAAGTAALLEKPIEEGRLLDTIRRALAARALLRSGRLRNTT